MDTRHPIEKDPKPVPHDPRNEPLPAENEKRPTENAEEEARKEEGVGMKGNEAYMPDGLREQDVIINPTGGDLPTGIQTGQTTRGSYSTDPATGAGRYADHRAGKFETSDVAQPGNDQTVEPDPMDTKF